MSIGLAKDSAYTFSRVLLFTTKCNMHIIIEYWRFTLRPEAATSYPYS
jgi:hypothetical protein